MIKRQSINKAMLAIIVLIAPFQNLLYALANINIAGKNAYLVMTALIIVAGGLINYNRNRDRLKYFLIFIFFMTGFTITVIRENFYDENYSILDHRYITTYFIYFVCFELINRNIENILFVYKIIYTSGLMAAVIFAVNKLFFPQYIVGYGDSVGQILIVEESSRDLLLGSSISANLIIISLFSMLQLLKHGQINRFFTFISLLICGAAIAFSGSRFPISVFILFATYIIIRMNESKKIHIIMFLFIFISIILYYSDLIFYRFGAENSSRLEKWSVPIELYSKSFMNVLIGPSTYEENNATSLNGYYFSDMSYLYVSIYFGIFYAVVFYLYLWSRYIKSNYSRINIIFSIYVFINFAMTNSIIWEQWVMMSILLSCTLKRDYLNRQNLNNKR
jgi:hypothetical protein